MDRETETLTDELVLNNSIHALEQRLEQIMVALVRQQKAGRRHGREELKKFRRSRCTQIFQVCSDVVDDGK
tara:strand:+ start:1135 stop:1347 length:213 start_codon:yes stop_codon:yes gene_type:complete